MTATKSIFDKSYMIKAQAIKAAEKEFGADWAAQYHIVQVGKKFAVESLPVAPEAPAEEKTSFTLAEALAESGESIEELKDGHSAEAARADAMANATMGGPRAKLQFSTIKSPVKRVWHIADSMPKAARKDVIAECVAQGVASGTARTQYQAWFKASQECERSDIRKPYEKA